MLRNIFVQNISPSHDERATKATRYGNRFIGNVIEEWEHDYGNGVKGRQKYAYHFVSPGTQRVLRFVRNASFAIILPVLAVEGLRQIDSVDEFLADTSEKVSGAIQDLKLEYGSPDSIKSLYDSEKITSADIREIPIEFYIEKGYDDLLAYFISENIYETSSILNKVDLLLGSGFDQSIGAIIALDSILSRDTEPGIAGSDNPNINLCALKIQNSGEGDLSSYMISDINSVGSEHPGYCEYRKYREIFSNPDLLESIISSEDLLSLYHLLVKGIIEKETFQRLNINLIFEEGFTDIEIGNIFVLNSQDTSYLQSINLEKLLVGGYFNAFNKLSRYGRLERGFFKSLGTNGIGYTIIESIIETNEYWLIDDLIRRGFFEVTDITIHQWSVYKNNSYLSFNRFFFEYCIGNNNCDLSSDLYELIGNQLFTRFAITEGTRNYEDEKIAPFTYASIVEFIPDFSGIDILLQDEVINGEEYQVLKQIIIETGDQIESRVNRDNLLSGEMLSWHFELDWETIGDIVEVADLGSGFKRRISRGFLAKSYRRITGKDIDPDIIESILDFVSWSMFGGLMLDLSVRGRKSSTYSITYKLLKRFINIVRK